MKQVRTACGIVPKRAEPVCRNFARVYESVYALTSSIRQVNPGS
jgi:hypothetical protein